jgi:2-oxo-4-hydroxy-4-carboxy-5-ureidoimidazoline decarboxylase
MTLQDINGLSADAAAAEFTRCCGAARWAAEMAARRPFADEDELYAVADSLWPLLTGEDWREAFAHHPKIGDRESLRARFAATAAWASGEQAGVQAASDEVLDALATGNAAYETRFGSIFIVCATGKTADEMLALLQARLPNPPEEELSVAAEEQKKITRLRLEKLLAG